MIQNVLTVTGTVLQTAKQFDQFRMDSGNTGIQNSPLTGLLNTLFHFPLGFVVDFFNAGRMNPSVLNQSFHG